MPTTLNARIPFPEQEDGLDVVFPTSTNTVLYAQLASLPNNATQQVTSKAGITILVEPINGHPDAHKAINAALRLMSHVTIVRRDAELLLATFELNDENRPMFGIKTMGDVVAEINGGNPAVATAEPPSHPPSSDTIVGSGQTTPMQIPMHQAPRALTEDDWKKVRGPAAQNPQEGAQRALDALFGRRL